MECFVQASIIWYTKHTTPIHSTFEPFTLTFGHASLIAGTFNSFAKSVLPIGVLELIGQVKETRTEDGITYDILSKLVKCYEQITLSCNENFVPYHPHCRVQSINVNNYLCTESQVKFQGIKNSRSELSMLVFMLLSNPFVLKLIHLTQKGRYIYILWPTIIIVNRVQRGTGRCAQEILCNVSPTSVVLSCRAAHTHVKLIESPCRTP